MPILDKLFSLIANGKSPFLKKIDAGLRDALPESIQVTELIGQAKQALHLGDYEQAASFYGQACQLDPKNFSAHIGYGYALLNIAQYARAERVLLATIALNSQSSDAHYMLGTAYLAQNKLAATGRAWAECRPLLPKIEQYYADYCHYLYRQGDVHNAIAIAREGVHYFPASAEMSLHLGNMCAVGGRYDAAVSAYRSAIESGPPNPALLSNYSTALKQTGQLALAIEAAQKSVELAPNEPEFFSNYLLAIQYTPSLSKAEKFSAHQAYAERFETPYMHLWGGYSNPRSSQRKLRVGYVSGDFRTHSLMFFIEPIFANHDKAAIELYCYYAFHVEDDATARLKTYADHWVSCHGMPDDELALRIRSDQIDILIDLSGHTGNNRLPVFARKPAPVQMTWLGYQATTGLKAMDYRITEESLDPTGTSEEYHSERLLRLPSSGTFSPHPDSPPVAPMPVTQGHPFTFGCLNNPSKISDEALKLWARILVQAENSRILIGNANTDLSERFVKAFAAYGVAEHRLLFLPKVSLLDYLALHGQIDLALDTFPYNGGTTTFHSLWMGVPVLALDGDAALAKVGVSVMRGLDLPQFCSETRDDYVHRAVYFAKHAKELIEVRSLLRPRMDGWLKGLAKDITENLELALRDSWLAYCDSASVPRNP